MKGRLFFHSFQNQYTAKTIAEKVVFNYNTDTDKASAKNADIASVADNSSTQEIDQIQKLVS